MPRNLRFKDIRAIAFDIDDTFSSDGKITSKAFEILWKLHDHGLILVPVTGRPAGWCDHIARFWPVHAVVGENGAFTFFVSKNKLTSISTPGSIADSKKRKQLIEKLGQKIMRRFPDAKWASDQDYRKHDLAIDICEDVPKWKPTKVKALLQLCQASGAHAKLSSIHVNAWYGEYDKWAGFCELQKQHQLWAPKVSWKWIQNLDHWIFLGDSPNDEPMFKRFKVSAAMANLKPYLRDLKSPPTFIAKGRSGQGFREICSEILTHHVANRRIRS